MLDIGLASIHLFGFFTVVFSVGILTFEEIEMRTVWMVFAKPIKRSEYLTGKYIGIVLTVLLNVCLMSLILLGLCLLYKVNINISFLVSIIFILFELILVSAIAIVFSTVSTSLVTGMIFTFTLFLIGHLSHHLKYFSATSENIFLKWTMKVFYYLIPNLEYFNLKDKLYAIENISIPYGFVFKVFLYMLIYSATTLAIAIAVFDTKEF